MNDNKLGVDTGSLVNHLYAQGDPNIPVEVGHGATILLWTDRHACTVTRIEGKKRKVITIQRDHVNRVGGNGMSDDQQYEFSPDPEGVEYRVSFTKGAWRIMGVGTKVRFGTRDHYFDYTF